MKIFGLLLSSIMFVLCHSYAQKKNINGDVYLNWTEINSPQISDNGKYVAYEVNRGIDQGAEIIIRSKTKIWIKKAITQGFFSKDSKKFIYQSNDTLFALNMDADSVKEISSDLRSFEKTENRDWLTYRTQKDNDELVLVNLNDFSVGTYNNVRSFSFDKEGSILLLEKVELLNGEKMHFLEYIFLSSRKQNIIWSEVSTSSDLKSFNFISNKGLIWFQISGNSSKNGSIWFYDCKNNTSKKLFDDLSKDMPSGFFIAPDPIREFTARNNMLFFKLKKNDSIGLKKDEYSAINIWHYDEEKIQPAQDSQNKDIYTAAYDFSNGRIILLEKDDDSALEFSCAKGGHIGNYLISLQVKYPLDFWWHKNFSNSIWLLTTKDGSRRAVLKNCKHSITNVSLSPEEKFVTWYDRGDNQYYSYEISTGIIKCISDRISYPLFDDEKAEFFAKLNFGRVGWLKGDAGILIYDRFDIWEIDPKGEKQPVNITNGYGRKNNIVLGFADEQRDRILSIGEIILLGGFNRKTKENGFWRVKYGEGKDPQVLIRGPFTYFIPRTVPHHPGMPFGFEGRPPIKAKDVSSYIFTRMSASKSPNLFLTKDFLSFTTLSEVNPEKEYNWMTSELINWEMINGRKGTGILYKPENFDPKRKYPIIFYYYEESSDALHTYIKPALSSANINIPQYVSNGYLVFVPDIYYELGKTGDGAFNSVVSAAKFLSSFSWVDSTKLGIEGTSLGGFETAYLVTHSNIFAAACQGAGPVNVISEYGQLANNSIAAPMLEYGALKLGKAPYLAPNCYVDNSPIFNVDKVQTPLLIWHGKQDKIVPFEQSVEMFISMRRAGKKVWLLQYDEGGHGLDGKDAVDLDKRMRQFFDYYLKGEKAPLWMTEGVPARFKQIKTGFALDDKDINP